MKKSMADITAIRLTKAILMSAPEGIILPSHFSADAANDVAEFIKTLSEKLASDTGDMTTMPLSDVEIRS